jgi:hypothetical protein
MAKIVELVQAGPFLEGLPDEVAQDADALCQLMTGRITDAVLALGLFEEASAAMRATHEREAGGTAWEDHRRAVQAREQDLAAQNPAPSTNMWDREYRTWEDELREQAARDVLRAKWAAGQLPNAYEQGLPFLHARSFILALAQLQRALLVLAKLDTGDAKRQIAAARDEFAVGLSTIRPVRDSIEHAEDRMRSLDRKRQRLDFQPISNAVIEAPGGALVGEALYGRLYGCTVEDGSYAEVEVSDATIEVARAAVQQVLDVLPWRRGGFRVWTPSA